MVEFAKSIDIEREKLVRELNLFLDISKTHAEKVCKWYNESETTYSAIRESSDRLKENAIRPSLNALIEAETKIEEFRGRLERSRLPMIS